jgi:hypothetical protein
MKGKEISFVHKVALLPVAFMDGQMVVVPEKFEPAPPPPPAPSPPHAPAPPVARPAPEFPKRNKAANYSREPMTESEMVHFNSDVVGMGPFFEKLEPIVKAYACDQTRKPVDVSARLNGEGYKTAEGAAWTPRLVFFLLALMFNKPKLFSICSATCSAP